MQKVITITASIPGHMEASGFFESDKLALDFVQHFISRACRENWGYIEIGVNLMLARVRDRWNTNAPELIQAWNQVPVNRGRKKLIFTYVEKDVDIHALPRIDCPVLPTGAVDVKKFWD